MPMCDYISFFIIFRSKFLFNYKVLGIVDIAKFYAGRPFPALYQNGFR